MSYRTISSTLRPTGEDIRECLADYGYTSNPEGLIQFFSIDFVFDTQTTAYLDVHAAAVRKGNEVPDRPVRITFRKIFDGNTSRWELESVGELAPGVETRAHDRDSNTPKVSPWPDKKAT